MAVAFPAEQIEKLVKLYRRTILSIADDFVKEIDFTRPRSFSIMQSMIKRLETLDDRTEAWARKVIPGFYEAVRDDTQRSLHRLLRPAQRRALKIVSNYAIANDLAVQALLYDPTNGFVPILRNHLGQIKGRLQTIHNQGKMLRNQRERINEIVASESVLKGKNINAVRDEIVQELKSKKGVDDLVWIKRARRASADSMLFNVASLPYVKIPTAAARKGFRLERIDNFARMLARTKTAQANSVSMQNTLLENGQEVFQVSNNLPLVDDICGAYIGVVVAMTRAAAEQHGIIHISELPGGSAPPWHPNCRHVPIPYVIPLKTPEEIEAGMGARPPSWAKNRSFAEADAEWKKHGGISKAGKDVNRRNIQAAQKAKGAIDRPDWAKKRKPIEKKSRRGSKSAVKKDIMKKYGIDSRTAKMIVDN